jgi:hypothetical protein
MLGASRAAGPPCSLACCLLALPLPLFYINFAPRTQEQRVGDDSRFFNPLCCPPQ